MAGIFHHRVLSASYLPLKFANSAMRTARLAPTDRLRVLLYHDIAPSEQATFCEQLRWLAREWNFVTPQQFGDMVAGATPVRGPNLLLTFDDGYASNRIVAEEILDPLGIRALFFVVSDFMAVERRKDAREFIAKHILPTSTVDALPGHLENMRWSDLEFLLERGHSIGGHTRTHAMLSTLNSIVDLEREIVEGADVIERRLGVSVQHFAYTFGNLQSITREALAVCQRRFRFVYSGLRGDNSFGIPRVVIRREAVDPRFPKSLLGAFVEGIADFRYAKDAAALENWSRTV